jgi:hypothetical protein
LDIVNLWRQQIGLKQITDADLLQLAQAVPVGELEGRLFNLAGAPNSILAAVLQDGQTSWFFKMTGPAELVESQQSSFRQFLASVRLGQVSGDPHASIAGADRTPRNPGIGMGPARPSWQVPAGWRETPPTVMALARFVLGQQDEAEVTVTPLAGAAGGLLDNVNRWRNQLGLAPIAENQLEQTTQPLAQAGTGAMLVEMTGKNVRAGGRPAAMLVAIVPRQEQTWFYKLLGDPALVGETKPAFIGFVQSVSYTDG